MGKQGQAVGLERKPQIMIPSEERFRRKLTNEVVTGFGKILMPVVYARTQDHAGCDLTFEHPISHERSTVVMFVEVMPEHVFKIRQAGKDPIQCERCQRWTTTAECESGNKEWAFCDEDGTHLCPKCVNEAKSSEQAPPTA
jgi:hypothetical protein